MCCNELQLMVTWMRNTTWHGYSVFTSICYLNVNTLQFALLAQETTTSHIATLTRYRQMYLYIYYCLLVWKVCAMNLQWRLQCLQVVVLQVVFFFPAGLLLHLWCHKLMRLLATTSSGSNCHVAIPSCYNVSIIKHIMFN